MTDLSTTFMELKLKNPIIAGSSALSNTVAGGRKLEGGGAGAVILKSLEDLETWMTRHGYEMLENFRGKMSQDKSADPAVYERVQFMKYFSGQKETI